MDVILCDFKFHEILFLNTLGHFGIFFFFKAALCCCQVNRKWHPFILWCSSTSGFFFSQEHHVCFLGVNWMYCEVQPVTNRLLLSLLINCLMVMWLHHFLLVASRIQSGDTQIKICKAWLLEMFGVGKLERKSADIGAGFTPLDEYWVIIR